MMYIRLLSTNIIDIVNNKKKVINIKTSYQLTTKQNLYH
jgi:hypothetical protein